MSSVSSVAPSIANLLQNLTEASPVASANILSDLQNASPGEVAQLSSEAAQLQEMTALFGTPATATDAATQSSTLQPSVSSIYSNNILQQVDAPLLSAPPSPAVNPADVANQVAAYQSALQAQQMQALFGDGSVAAPNPGVNLLA